jgi:hypothetical protein
MLYFNNAGPLPNLRRNVWLLKIYLDTRAIYSVERQSWCEWIGKEV